MYLEIVHTCLTIDRFIDGK